MRRVGGNRVVHFGSCVSRRARTYFVLFQKVLGLFPVPIDTLVGKTLADAALAWPRCVLVAREKGTRTIVASQMGFLAMVACTTGLFPTRRAWRTLVRVATLLLGLRRILHLRRCQCVGVGMRRHLVVGRRRPCIVDVHGQLCILQDALRH